MDSFYSLSLPPPILAAHVQSLESVPAEHRQVQTISTYPRCTRPKSREYTCRALRWLPSSGVGSFCRIMSATRDSICRCSVGDAVSKWRDRNASSPGNTSWKCAAKKVDSGQGYMTSRQKYISKTQSWYALGRYRWAEEKIVLLSFSYLFLEKIVCYLFCICFCFSLLSTLREVGRASGCFSFLFLNEQEKNVMLLTKCHTMVNNNYYWIFFTFSKSGDLTSDKVNSLTSSNVKSAAKTWKYKQNWQWSGNGMHFNWLFMISKSFTSSDTLVRPANSSVKCTTWASQCVVFWQVQVYNMGCVLFSVKFNQQNNSSTWV